MTARRTLVAGLRLCAALLPVACGAPPGPESQASSLRPNVVFVLLDDVPYGDFGVAGGGAIETPRIDRLAADGIRFSNAYASAPVCSPTRAAILTGRYPAAFGIRRSIVRTSHRGIPAGVVTLAELLRDAGYATAHIGKWHLGGQRAAFLPGGQGFDHTVLPVRGGSYQHSAVEIDGQRIVRPPGHQTAVYTDYAIRFVREHRDVPFFLNLWYLAPHTPLEPPEDWAARYPDDDLGRYAALLGFADAQIGRLLDAIDELGLAERTLVVVTSDNGGVATHPRTSFQGGKAQVSEGGIRIPLVMRGPGLTRRGASHDAVVVSFDFLPTLAELLGLDAAPRDLHGESFAWALRGAPPPPGERTLVWENRSVVAARAVPAGNLNDWAVRRGRYKLVHAGSSVHLFDLEEDPGEHWNLGRVEAGVAAELERAYRDWRRAVTRIRVRTAARGPGVTLVSGGWQFDGSGSVRLPPNPLYDFHDGDFSLAVRVALDPTAPAAERDRAIARRPGSWALRLRPDGRVALSVQGDDGTAVELASEDRLVAGREMQVAFTVLGFRYTESVVRLHVGGRAEGVAMEIASVRPGDATIELGGGGGEAFRGTLRDLRLFTACLVPEELAALGRSP